MISLKEQKDLDEMLALADEQGREAFTVPELAGFLYGLAITPDLVMPSEWMPVVFGGEMPEFESPKQLQGCMETLLHLANRFASAFHGKELQFPYDLSDPATLPLDDLLEWPRGLQQALMLRPECWLREEVPFAADEEQRELLTSLAVIAAISDPDNAEELFPEAPTDGEEEASRLAVLIAALPSAVTVLQNHAAKSEQVRRFRGPQTRIPGLPVHAVRVGRNDPCPCGSGKKFKRCCLKGENGGPRS